jgi:adenine-specific DNA-methyltransferase
MPKQTKKIESLRHGEAKRPNIPTAEYEPVVDDALKTPVLVAYERRNPDLDPQLIWRGKELRDWSELVVPAPPLYIQEKVQPKALVDDLLRQSRERAQAGQPVQLDIFADFNGIPQGATATDFYRHPANWTNRLILGDSLQVMASLAEREGLRGKVQCIYIDPPYGIKFNSNFQWSTTSRTVQDGNTTNITREPEQVKAFRDTWRYGIHSYLTYMRDRLTVARELLVLGGSILVQISDENYHLIRGLLDEIFGDTNFVISIPFQKKAYQEANSLAPVNDYILWYARSREHLKYHQLYIPSPFEGDVGKYTRIESPSLVIDKSNNKDVSTIEDLMSQGWKLVREDYPVVSQDPPSEPQPLLFQGVEYHPPRGRHWSQKYPDGMLRLAKAGRLRGTANRLYGREYWLDSPVVPRNNLWTKLKGPANPNYVVETAPEVVQRCILMTTDPGDLVLDPTCGSGTTAYVAEQWGRRWITIDTSRVALALARARIMGARYPYYLLADSPAGQKKEAELRGLAPSSAATFGDLRHGFVYQSVPRITFRAIANNAALDVIWERYQAEMEPLRAEINRLAGEAWEEWEMPRVEEYRDRIRNRDRNRDSEESITITTTTTNTMGEEDRDRSRDRNHNRNPEESITITTTITNTIERWWELRVARQREIDAGIAAAADQEFLYDRPYEDRSIVRVAGPFTVESLSPHRVIG